ncbi:hypothetical protein SCLCIDRAFT_1223802 [Scleroderma citrinum Foug A]|uniref:Uncharacterized protein n=1 Tax=Scleroderma citrinum Foug A TaxID=1036808 RepID=A0A0C3CV53_9AGAM|nr:hypothetical protein SCLCIDRAFT_1223802 [Scleroderma citrinum Foug A]
MVLVHAINSVFWRGSCTICFLGHRAQRIWICHGGSFTGYLYCTITKERLEEILNQVRNQIATDVRRTGPPPDFFDVGTPMKPVNFYQICLSAILRRTV